MTDHDQNFKNLILDYPRQALMFFAGQEIGEDIAEARIIPLREEQLKERLGDRYRKLDAPVMVEWPDGRRDALLFVLEEESEANKFSIYRLAHYCLDMAELMATHRVIPVVIFLRSGRIRPELLQLGSDNQTYLEFCYLSCYLNRLSANDYCESDNIVVRLNLPNMYYAPESRLAIYAAAQQGLATLESNPNLQSKYANFIDAYTDLSEQELTEYRERYLNVEGGDMGLAQILRQEGRQEGLQEGRQEGRQEGLQEGFQEGRQEECIALVMRLLRRRLGIHPEIDQALPSFQAMSVEQLEELAEALLDFTDIGDLTAWLQEHVA
jgi:hypothetical protein